MKWAVRGDNAEVKRTLVKSRSIGLAGRMKVKILDFGFGRRRVRVLTNSAGQAFLRDKQGTFPADLRIGRECWVVAERSVNSGICRPSILLTAVSRASSGSGAFCRRRPHRRASICRIWSFNAKSFASRNVLGHNRRERSCSTGQRKAHPPKDTLNKTTQRPRISRAGIRVGSRGLRSASREGCRMSKRRILKSVETNGRGQSSLAAILPGRLHSSSGCLLPWTTQQQPRTGTLVRGAGETDWWTSTRSVRPSSRARCSTAGAQKHC